MFIDYQQTPLGRQQHKKVVRIVHNLLDMKQSTIFRKPVCYRALGLDDYKDVVKKPIDLNMIRRLNNQWKYKYVEEVFDDIMLCWNNCRVYNKPGSEIYQAAVEMEQNFVQQLLQQYPDYKIPDGIIRGREPFVMPVASLVQPVEKAQRTIQVNPYDRKYDRPMNSRSKISERPEKSVNLREELRQEEGKEMQEMYDSMPVEVTEQRLSSQEQIRKKPKKTQSNSQPIIQEQPVVERPMEVEQQPHEPIIIQLPEKPSLQNIVNLSEKIKLIRDKTVLRGIVKIIMDMEPECSSVEQHTYRFNASSIRMNTYIRLEEYLESRIK